MVFAALFVLAIAGQILADDFYCRKKLALNDDQRELILDGHNSIRRKIARGRLANKAGLPPLGPAKNMYALEWDCELEEEAEESLAKCTLEEKVNAGRNMIQLNGGSLSDSDYMTIALNNWVEPVKFFGKKEPTNEYDGTHCQFANMVHANTTKVGCSFKRCGENYLFACLYNKCGTQEKLMWEKGDACKKDDDCTTFPDSDCSKGLCHIEED